jgi:hypothetical protein
MVCLPEQGCWAKLRYLPDSTLGIGTVSAGPNRRLTGNDLLQEVRSGCF